MRQDRQGRSREMAQRPPRAWGLSEGGGALGGSHRAGPPGSLRGRRERFEAPPRLRLARATPGARLRADRADRRRGGPGGDAATASGQELNRRPSGRPPGSQAGVVTKAHIRVITLVTHPGRQRRSPSRCLQALVAWQRCFNRPRLKAKKRNKGHIK